MNKILSRLVIVTLVGMSFSALGKDAFSGVRDYILENKNNYVQASPNKKKCFWAGKKVFYLKKFNGKLIFKN